MSNRLCSQVDIGLWISLVEEPKLRPEAEFLDEIQRKVLEVFLLAILSHLPGPDTALVWAGWKQPDIPVEVDTYRLETSRTEAGVLKKLSLAGIAKLSRLKYSWL
jgi:hypothetical protein